MTEYKIVHYENDGFNNVYDHYSFTAKSLDDAVKVLEEYIDTSDPLYIDDNEDDAYHITFEMFPNMEYEEDDEIQTETWSVITL